MTAGVSTLDAPQGGLMQPEAERGINHERRLAAVVFLDLVGYSALMQESEARAQAAVETLWGIARPLIASHRGEEIRLFGDGMLIVFSGTLAAAQCCLSILKELSAHNRSHRDRAPIQMRAGMHSGEIGQRGSEIFGDGVNLASRFVGAAPPGGLVVSRFVRDQLANTLEHPIQSIGHKRLKNIKEAVELFCLPGPDCRPEDMARAGTQGNAGLKRWHFGDACFDESLQKLSVNGLPVDLGFSSEQVLLCLLHYAGECVSRDELRDAAGGIADSTLGRAIDQLRKALGDEDHRCIRTQPGQGYRLVAPIHVETVSTAQKTQFDFRPGDHPPLRPLWSLEKLLGQGGQGEVWLASHDKTGEKRVYKFAIEDTQLGFLKREITLSRLLQQSTQRECFIRVLDWNLDRAPFFLECEYGGKADLLQWSEAGDDFNGMTLESRLEVLAQIADALAAAHSIGVLHKDLKPANILVNGEGEGPPQIKLADFGSGEVMDPDSLGSAGITQLGFSRAMDLDFGSTLSTPLYVAPEVLSGQPATVQADVYALGVMLYQFVAGDLRKPLSTGWERDVPDPLLRSDIQIATEGDPHRRLADAGSLARRLRSLQQRKQERAEREAAERTARRDARTARIAEQEVRRLRVRRQIWLGATVVLSLALFQTLYSQQLARAAAAESRAVAQFLGEDLFNVVSDTPLRELTVMQMLDQAAQKIGTGATQLPAISAQLHRALGNAFFAMEDVARASDQFKLALNAFDKAGHAGSADALAAAAQLIALNRGDHERLEPLLRRASENLIKGQDDLGQDHPAVLALRAQLALAHYDQGDWQLALEALRTITDSVEESSSGTSFASTRTRLGEVLLELGHFEESAAQQRRVLAGQPEPQARLGALLYLALAEIALEEFDAATRHLGEAAEIADRWTVGPASLLLDNVRLNQGLLHLRQGDASTALDLLNSSLATMEQHEYVRALPGVLARYRGWLAEALLVMNRPEEAEQQARLAMQQQEAMSGPDHPFVLALRILLAETLVALKRPEEALQALKAVALPTLLALGHAHPYLISYLRTSALAHRDLGLHADAQRMLEEALAASRKTYGNDHDFSRRLERELASG